MEDFVKVKRNTKRKNKEHSQIRSLEKRIFDVQSDLVLTSFYQDFKANLCTAVTELSFKGKIPGMELQDTDTLPSMDLVCYGLGSFTESYIARYQLALLMALRMELKTEAGVNQAYDPVFNQEEKEFLLEQNFSVPDENKEGKYQCSNERITVFYMPHCGKALYNNLLWRNWRRDGFGKMVVIGNSFSSMIDSTPSRILKKTASYVMKIHQYIKEIKIDCPADLDCIFNDTSIHIINSQEIPKEFWDESEEPIYDCEDAEIIFSSQNS